MQFKEKLKTVAFAKKTKVALLLQSGTASDYELALSITRTNAYKNNVVGIKDDADRILSEKAQKTNQKTNRSKSNASAEPPRKY